MYSTYFYHPKTGFDLQTLSAEGIKEAVKDHSATIWMDIEDIDDPDIDILTGVFNLHRLTVEDFIMANSRPKVENFNEYLYMVMFSMQPGISGKRRTTDGEMDICLGRNFLITCHARPISAISATADKVKQLSPLLKEGADSLLYSILDNLVQSYIPIINDFDSRVDDLSDELFGDPTNETLKKIYLLKNEITYLRRTIGPQADAISIVARGDMPHIKKSSLAYFRNIFDELVRLNDIVGTSRDIITGALESYVSIVSNKLNEIMKTLTVIATIMMPLTLIASIYGMNFKHMPELEARFGYPGVIMTMALVALVMIFYFKRRKWL